MPSVRQVFFFVLLSFSLPLLTISTPGEVKKPVAQKQESNHWSLPLAFERNEGQMPADIGFLGRTQRYAVAVGSRELRFSLPGERGASPIALSFEGSHAAAPSGLTEAPFRTNSYLGADVSKYRSGIRNYSRIGLSHVYPGIDAEFYASGDEIEHDFIVAPGADASAISMRLRSATAAKLTGQGEVLVPSAEGELRLKKPVAYQEGTDGKHIDVAADFVLDPLADGGQGIRFRLGAYDHSRKLVIDPVILYASYLSGTLGSTASAITTEPTNGIFVAGTTTSTSFDPTPAGNTITPVAPTANCGAAPCARNAFIANFTNVSGSAGPALRWITYIGATDATPAIAVTSVVANSTALYVGGYTNDSALAAGSTATAPNPTGGYVGFISGLAPASGTLNNTSLVYIDAANPNNNSVQALALDTAGNVYATGAIGTATGDLTPGVLQMVPTADAFAVNPAVTSYTSASTPQPGNAYVLKLPDSSNSFADPTTHVAHFSFFTYIQALNTSINGIAVDTAGSIYLGGQTSGDFSLQSAAGTNTAADGSLNAFELTFQDATVSLATTPAATVTAFTWIDGGADDTVAALALDATGNSYLFGNTKSTNLPASGGIQTTPADASGNGFIALVPPAPAFTPSDGPPAPVPAGGIPPTALTYVGGSGTHDSITGGAYATDGTHGTLYITGQTDAPALTSSSVPSTAFAAAGSTSGNSTAPFNKQAMVFGMDATTAGTPRGYLAALKSDLSAVNYVANLGGTGGPAGADIANGVALDNSLNAYVAATISVDSSSAATPPYTSYTAYQGTSQTTTPAANTAAYMAEIASASTSAGLILKAAPASPSVPQIGYSTTLASPVTFTWTLDSTAPATNLVVQISAVVGLDYTNPTSSPTIIDPANPSAPAFSSCTLTPAGISCLISSVPQATPGTNDTLNIVLTATPNSSLVQTATPTPITVTASVFSPASDYISIPQTTNISAPANLIITPASTFSAITVNSGSSASATANTQISYAITVANAAGAGDSGQASLLINSLPIGFTLSTTAPVAVTTTGGATANCGLPLPTTGCPSFDLPGGATLVYTLTGYYPDSTVPQGVASQLTTGTLTATASGFLSNFPASIATSTTVQRAVHLKVTNSLSATGPINLDAPETYTVTITNSGPSASSGLDTFKIVLPTGFVADSSPDPSCTFTSATNTYNCTLASLAASGGSKSYTVPGKFPDTSVNATTIGKIATAETFSATVTLNTASAVEFSALPSDESTSVPVNVQRTATLTVAADSLTATANVCKVGPSCAYMKNVADTGDSVAYNFIVNNAGPNTAKDATVTITLPFASTTHVFSAGTPTTATGGTLPTGLTPVSSCTYNAATNQITCPTGFLAVGNTALHITGSGTFDNTSVPGGVAFVNTSTGTVHVTEDANGAPSDATIAALEVDRAAHLVTTKSVAASGTTPSAPINLDENAPSLAPGVNDTLTVTVKVGNTQLNDAPGVVLTETLPPYFRVTVPPAITCMAGSPAVAVTANYATGATAVPMTCNVAGTINAGTATASSGGTAATVSAAPLFTYSGKFVDNGTAPDITGTLPNKVKLLNAPIGITSSATPLAVDPITPPDAATIPQTFAVERLAHLILRKTRNASVAAVPSSFADTTDPNLDEKTTATAFGVNDEVEYDIALGNAGVNKAIGVQFTEALPPYFTLMKAYLISGASTTPDTGANGVPGGQLPAGSIACYEGSAIGTTQIALPYLTGAGGKQITCSYGTPATPLSLAAGPSHTGAPDNATSVEFIYQGKYQDNAAVAPYLDNIGAGVSTYAVTSVPGDALAVTPLAVDNGPASDSKNLAVPTYSIQRAAHLAIVGTPVQLKPDETALTPGGPNNTPIIAEAEPSIGGATPVYNCLRYKVLVQNIGPNIARQPQLTVASPMGLNLTESPNSATTTPGSDAPLPSSCAYGATIPSTITGATIVPVSQRSGNTLVVDIDGYFGLNTLTSGNSQTGFPIAYAALIDRGVKDSAAASPFTTLTGGNVTVVNTPSGGNFLVSPFTATGTRPVKLSFGAVSTPGVTSTSVSSTGPALPTGSSPDPRDNKKVISLYKTGSAPSFYSLATSAVPAAGANPTGICLTNGAATGSLADGFAKPERVLLWALSGLPAGTALNPVPNVASPYLGDITSSVTPTSGSSYVAPGGPALPYTTYANLPGTQSQPAQVCGQVNGFAPAAAPVTVAVLEPVNFAPLISPNTATTSATPGKGVSEVSFLFPTVTHDYNDHDPCYVASSTSGTPSRGSCDDNLLLTTWIFGGESLVPSLNHVVGPLSPAAAQAFENAPTPYEVQSGATLFLQVADQLAAPVYNAKQDCDPGNAAGTYTPNTVNACPINTSLLAGNPPQETVFGSANIAILTPSVSGGNSGLITLPPAADATVATTPVASGYVPATATVTAGQTVGFQWKLGDVIPAAGGTYTLTCFMVDAATQNTAAPFPPGLSCQIPQSITYPANPTPANSPANPAIYIVTTGTQSARMTPPTWKTAAEGIVAAMLLPLLLFRRRKHARKLGLLAILLLLGGAVSLSGCGSGVGTGTTTSTTIAANTYYFRANAAPVKGGTTLTTAPFQVKVVAGD